MNNPEWDKLSRIISDLKIIFEDKTIELEEIASKQDRIETEEVKSYLNNLLKGTKPEVALREAFFAGPHSVLSQYLSPEFSPEININAGFIDYQIGEGNESVLLELKSLFETELRESNSGREIVRLVQKPLKWQVHEEQILKYIREKGEFIIITNLKEWYFFNKNVRPGNCEPFFSTTLPDFVEEFNVTKNLVDFSERHDLQATRENLDIDFFTSLKSWVKILSQIEYDTTKMSKIDLVITLINKFVFIQTLDDYSAVEFRWLQKTWEHEEKRWISKGKYKVLESFFEEITSWFYEYYDTELFRENIFKYVKNEDSNIEKFYENLQLVVGINYWKKVIGGYRGIMQYTFRYIDEDIFGKSYETYLAEVRHDEGIYYTPSYITEFIIEKTVGEKMSTLYDKIQKSIMLNNLQDAITLTNEFISIKVLDPACGSGSFLVKTTKKIMSIYKKLSLLVLNKKSDLNLSLFNHRVENHEGVESMISDLQIIEDKLRFGTDRDLISIILLRHIYGNDLDPKATEVAKVNLWTEAIKMAPKDFRFDQLPNNTNRILPNLEMNLTNGDSVAGLSIKKTIQLLEERSSELREMSQLREEYMLNPTKPELIEKIKEIKKGIGSYLDKMFEKYIVQEKLPHVQSETKIFHWPLEFWYLYFDEKGQPYKDPGPDIVIGNPPYKRIQVIKKGSPVYAEYLSKAGFKSTTINYDLAVVFIEIGYDLIKENGQFCYIVTNKFMQADYGVGIRGLLSDERAVKEIVNFGDQQVFEEAKTYTTLLFLSRSKNEYLLYSDIKKLEKSIQQLRILKDGNKTSNNLSFSVKSDELTSDPWEFRDPDHANINDILSSCETLGSIKDRIFQGLVTGADQVFILKLVSRSEYELTAYSKSLQKEVVLERSLTRPLLKGSDIKRWVIGNSEEIIVFPYNVTSGSAELIDKENFKRYPKTWEYLLANKETLENREPTFICKWQDVINLNQNFVRSMKDDFGVDLEGILNIEKDHDKLTVFCTKAKKRVIIQGNKSDATLTIEDNTNEMNINHKILLRGDGLEREICVAKKWKDVPNWYAFGRTQNIGQFDQPKIIVQNMSSKSTFSVDMSERYYFVGGGTAGGYGITLKNQEPSLRFLTGLLNSSLLDWKLRQKSSRFERGFYSHGQAFLEPLPIKIPLSPTEVNISKDIESLVIEIENLSKGRLDLISIWSEWSKKLCETEYTLIELLESDLRDLKYIEDPQTYFTNVTFYLDKKRDELNEEFDNIDISADSENKSIKIIGFNEFTEREIYELNFDKKNMIDHLYFSILKALTSKVNIKTLKHILEKTTIPVIRPYPQAASERIIIKTKEIYGLDHTGLPSSIVELDHEIEKKEAQTDAKVFKLYNLSPEEIVLIMNNLPVSSEYQQKVLYYYEEK